VKAQKGGSAMALPVIKSVHEVRLGIQDNTILKQTEADTRVLLWCIGKLWKVFNLAFVNRSVGKAGSRENVQSKFKFLSYSEEHVNMKSYLWLRFIKSSVPTNGNW
jgi:hypothetical protein